MRKHVPNDAPIETSDVLWKLVAMLLAAAVLAVPAIRTIGA
jgi:hypothetical protein